METIWKNRGDGRTKLACILKKQVRCDELAQDRNHWKALVNVALNLQVTSHGIS